MSAAPEQTAARAAARVDTAPQTRNMVTGASTADLTIVLVDAREGLLTQSRRHAAIAGLLGIPRIVLAVNKMDLVDYSEDVFRRICGDFRGWAPRLDVDELACIPISALKGDNVVEKGGNLDWFGGPTPLRHLEAAPVSAGVAGGPLRWVIREPSLEHRSYAGQLASGTAQVAENRVTGSFILIDEATNETVGAGMIDGGR